MKKLKKVLFSLTGKISKTLNNFEKIYLNYTSKSTTISYSLKIIDKDTELRSPIR